MGLQADKRITNSEGANVSTNQGFYVYGNSHDFIGAYPTTRHSISCVLVAKEGEQMQRDYDYTSARVADDLWSIQTVAANAVERSLRRLNPQCLTTQKAPVIFSADIARSLLGHFLSAISGGQLYRRSSFLVDQDRSTGKIR